MMINFKQPIIDFQKGTVILAGAGPGSQDLLTIKVNQAIEFADVIIYDALVNSKLLKIAKGSARLIFGGKLKNKKACSQKEINDWMVSNAVKNKRVLRLKGGDISFFSRGSQEINVLKKNNIPFRVFSGITSSQHAIKYSVLTFFNRNNVCNFITGHRQTNDQFASDAFEKIYSNKGRIIIYMGVGQINKISHELIKLGMKKNTKVYIVSNASLQNEKIISTSLSRVQDSIIHNKILPPSIIIIN